MIITQEVKLPSSRVILDSNRALSKSLRAQDWDFEISTEQAPVHQIHPYPAKFIPAIPRKLIQQLRPRQGSWILDPFCGSGTTLVEAQALQIPSVGIDLNPIACLISRVKTKPLPIGFEKAVLEVSSTAGRMKNVSVPLIPNLNHWFKPAIQGHIAAIRKAIGAISNIATREALLLALSSILVRVSNQESDTRYAAIEKNITVEQVNGLFLAACKRILRAKEASRFDVPVEVVLADTLALNATALPKPIGLVITSPPYPNAYEYWLYHKYRMFWLGYDPLAVKEKEIGARAHFFKKNHHTAGHFYDQMNKTLALIRNVLTPGGFACFVVGRSTIHGETVDNAAAIVSAGKALGFQCVDRITRVIARHRKSFNLSHARILTEEIVILSK